MRLTLVFFGSGRVESGSFARGAARIRTGEWRFCRPLSDSPEAKLSKGLRRSHGSVARSLPTDACLSYPDLAAIVTAWPKLPEAIKSGIVAMVKAASGNG